VRVLHIMPYLPVRRASGGPIRVYHLLKVLAERHDVTVLAYGSQEDADGLRQSFDSRLRGIHVVPRPWPVRSTINKRLGQFAALLTNHSFYHLWIRDQKMQSEINRLLSDNDFDVVQSEFSVMGFFRLESEAVKILDVHDVEHDKIRRMWSNTRSPLRRFHYRREHRKFFREEAEVCSSQDALFVTSMRDKELLDAMVPQVPKFYIPNGVDSSYFKPYDGSAEPASLVFTGLMSYVPNYDGILHFLDEVFPLVKKEIPEAKIYIVGDRPTKALLKRSSESIIVTGYVDDVRPFVWRSSVYVVPLRMGGGTRLKIFEAMAMRKPIVTTSIGCEGIDVRDGESVLIADDPQAFADATVKLLRNAALRRELGENGFEFAKSQHDWSVIGEHVDEAYQTLVASAKEHSHAAFR
jgi:glycosyltransferase involved in cell wall biosynthesis